MASFDHAIIVRPLSYFFILGGQFLYRPSSAFGICNSSTKALRIIWVH